MTAHDKSVFDDVKQFIRDACAEGRATSIALAVMQNGMTVYEDVCGHVSVEHQTLATLDTPYCIASITKILTATLVAILAEKYKFSLDDDVQSHLPPPALRYLNDEFPKVTIRMLAAHCSGLPGTFAAHVIDGSTPVPPQADFLERYGCVVYPPGEVYEYGNIGFEVLGALVESLTGETFAAAMHKYILEPMRMQNSFFSSDNPRITSAATGYDASKQAVPLYKTSTPPSGELYTSVRDLTRFATEVLREATSNRVLSETVVQAIQTPVFEGARGIASTFGWYRGQSAHGEPFFFKGGGQPGVATNLWVLPSYGVSCAVLTNRTDNWDLVKDICKKILRNYVPKISISWEGDMEPLPRLFVPATEVLGEWRGILQNGGAHQTVRLRMVADGNSTFALSGGAAEELNDMKEMSPGFEGTTSGHIECENQEQSGARELKLRLMPWQGRLVGRVTACGPRPGVLSAHIPYAITLERPEKVDI